MKKFRLKVDIYPFICRKLEKKVRGEVYDNKDQNK